MKKSKKVKTAAPPNPVAKHAHQFNKAQVFRDKTQYRRKAKHHNAEPLPIPLQGIIGKGFAARQGNVI
ncbi:MAG: hypothetical protein CVV13_08895 [Gammaproteobacteria bacterium HGW-Gammaproteobacteria-3]|nr:MAG: hypothetical protein CVV13_08895 [Gammaproteobacteria bacterium HGW-Gammaproteobacteria-3]